MGRERYTLEEARVALGISKSGLEGWMRRAHIKPTRDELDMRLYWLSAAQVEQLASAHRRKLADVGALGVQDVDAALTERIEALEQRQAQLEERLAVLEAPRTASRPHRPLLVDMPFDSSASQNRTTDALEGISEDTEGAGMMLLADFARSCGMNPRTVNDQARNGVINATHREGKWYVTLEQQEAARKYWGK